MRLIDADALKKQMEERVKHLVDINGQDDPYTTGLKDACDHIENAPTIDIEPVRIDRNTSDGYHTFNELYHHRAVLFSVIVKAFPQKAWKSRKHYDGTMFDGMFIVGIETPEGNATYHYDLDPYWNIFECPELEFAPEWDGHTPDQSIARIGKLEPARHGK